MTSDVYRSAPGHLRQLRTPVFGSPAAECRLWSHSPQRTTMQQRISALGHWIKERRRAIALSREALADHVGCSIETIRKIETGRRRPSLQIAERMATALQISEPDRPQFLQLARAKEDLSGPT